jgi:hypothetical protein
MLQNAENERWVGVRVRVTLRPTLHIGSVVQQACGEDKVREV